MIPFWDSDLTIYHKAEDEDLNTVWIKYTVRKSFFKVKTEDEKKQFIIRIPKIGLELQKGDIIVKGLVNDEINESIEGQRSSDLLLKYGTDACTVNSIAVNNFKGLVPHTFIGGL